MWNAFDRWFDRHKYGVIGTLLLHSFVLLGFSIAEISSQRQEENKEEEYLEIVTPMTDAELQAIADQSTAQQQPQGEVTNAISNAMAQLAQPSAATMERFEAKSMEDLKEMERQEFDRLAQERTARGEEIVVPALTPEKWDKKLYMEPAKPIKLAGNVTVEHNLTDRSANIAVPAYKCKSGGTVTIDVEVDRSGHVKRSSLNQAASTTSDACMTDLAEQAAVNAAFSPSTSAGDPQKGWIKFIFVPQ
ncbi:MAG: energy transducer TonB [Flavobacteriales bacterium]